MSRGVAETNVIPQDVTTSKPLQRGFGGFVPGPAVVAPAELEATGRLCVGDGAVRYREVLEASGGEVPPDDDPRHRPRAVFHALLAEALGPVDEIEPIYVRAPDAERWRG